MVDGVLIHPWDAPAEDEWRAWLAGHDFGELIAPDQGRDLPIVVPTHFVYDGAETIRLHLARPNPVWQAFDEHPRALLAVTGDVAYVRSDWNTPPGGVVERGVPTSYYASVQVECDVRVLDDPAAKAALLTHQLGHFEPGVGRADVSPTDELDRRQLPGIRGVELTVTRVRAKFKYGGNKTKDHRDLIATRFDGDVHEHIRRQS